MEPHSRAALALAACLLAACSKPPEPPQKATPAGPAMRITQFYATAPKLAKGEQELLCYGVEGAASVSLEPPKQELSAALSRCVEVKPVETTRYVLTATDAQGKSITQELTVTVGAARVKIVEVKVNALQISRGQPVSICYVVQNARSVEIEPIHYRGGANPKGCTAAQPDHTTTYVVTAIGADGGRDQERVEVKVQ